MRGLRRSRRWDSRGVSEVIGTILTLSLTVLLFSSIIAFVGRFPSPNKNTFTSFTGTVRPSQSWANGAEVIIVHEGGKMLDAATTNILLTVDGNTTVRTVSTGANTWFNSTDSIWEPGEAWTVHLLVGQLPNGASSSIQASVVDAARNTLVWSSNLLGGGNPYAPIIMDGYADSDLTTARRDPIQNGQLFTFFVRITDPNGDLNTATATVDLARLGLGASEPLNYAGESLFKATVTMGNTPTSPGYYPVTVRASDLAAHSVSKVILVVLGAEIGQVPNIVVEELVFSPDNPVNGDTINMRVKISNVGLGNATIRLRVWDRGAVVTGCDIGVNIGGSPDQWIQEFVWRGAGPGGTHTVNVTADVTSPVPDFDTSDNWLVERLTISPRILLVDDDSHSDGSYLDTARFIRESLACGGFEYDFTSISSGDGPTYSGGSIQLKTYDVVIWNTGYETQNTLRANDQLNLIKYLDDTGSLWMVGQGYLADPGLNPSFIMNYLHLASATPMASGPSDPLVGNPAHPVASNWSAPADWIDVTTRVTGKGNSWSLIPAPGAVSMFDITGLFSDAVSHENATAGVRVVTFPWDFSRITDLSVQAEVAYSIILWLGELAEKDVVDFALSGQTITPSTVYYKETVTISAWIRNNGDESGNVSVDVTLDGNPQALSYNSSVFVDANGGKALYTWTWVADLAGRHTLVVRVDPNDDIVESNENNNKAAGYVTSSTIYVLFRLLVVDDDGSVNNGGVILDASSETVLVTAALDAFDCAYSVEVIPNGNSFPMNKTMGNYSAIIWVSGPMSDALTVGDRAAMAIYLAAHGRVWLQGRNAANISDALFLAEYFAANGSTPNQAMPGYVDGLTDDALGHGIRYKVAAGARCDVVEPTTLGVGYLLQNGAAGDALAVRHNGSYTTVLNAFSLADLTNGGWEEPNAGEARSELAFLILNWMGRPESRTELKVSRVDFLLSELHPQIGSAYVLKASIHALCGDNEANALVRFLDGNTTVGSDSIAVTPGGWSTAEVIWKPLATGSRVIRVQVDPLQEHDEVFEGPHEKWLNNNATYQVKVYFFYDDMQNTTASASKWSHYATLVNINSEGPLDFLPASFIDVKTDVIKEWDYGAGFTTGITNTTKQYHSFNESYYMEEASGSMTVRTRNPMDIVFCLDTSTSMNDALGGSTKIDQLKVATRNFIGNLADTDRAAIYRFDGAGNPQRLRDWAWMVDANQTSFNTSVTNIVTSDATPFYDTLGASINYARTYDATCTDRSRFEYVLALTDGQSNRDDTWTPNCDWGTTMTDNQYTNGGANVAGMQGLRKAPPMVYTVGLGTNHDPLYPTCDVPPGFSYTPPRSGSGYDQEFDLWNCANSTPVNPPGGNYGWNNTTTPHRPLVGHYYYCNDAGQLPSLFATIFSQIIIGQLGSQNQTRSGSGQPSPSYAGPGTDGVDPPGTCAANSNKSAISPVLDLRNYASARLSFWHKYNMVAGGNGGVMGVMLRDPPTTGTWKFWYIIPSGSYTGGLYYRRNVTDDFGQTVKWCWNGVSGAGTFSWDYVDIDILQFIPDIYKDQVRIAFKYIQFGGGTGAGWWLDDVQLKAYRGDLNPVVGSKDVWEITSTTDRNGQATNAWWNRNPSANGLLPGTDDSLVTIPIDLTNAITARLDAYFRFNINMMNGTPPDCLRVEVTPDGGANWYSISLGVRAGWGLSGTGNDIDDNKLDGKAYTGLPPTGNPADAASTNYWVHTSTLSRLNVDLSSFRGRQVQLRFRAVVNNLPAGTYAHYGQNQAPWGIYIDDITVTGTTKFA
jgi:FlaG/FlaF family flagellin (archaellin)